MKLRGGSFISGKPSVWTGTFFWTQTEQGREQNLVLTSLSLQTNQYLHSCRHNLINRVYFLKNKDSFYTEILHLNRNSYFDSLLPAVL